MNFLPSQCRAARALLGWSQEELENHARIAKRTIASFEQGEAYPQERTSNALRTAMESHGVIFLPDDIQGAGVRMKDAMPRLFRRFTSADENWICFDFDYRSIRYNGFVAVAALGRIALDQLAATEVFDRDTKRILSVAAKKVDASDFDPENRVVIRSVDIAPVGFDV